MGGGRERHGGGLREKKVENGFSYNAGNHLTTEAGVGGGVLLQEGRGPCFSYFSSWHRGCGWAVGSRMDSGICSSL